MDPILSISLIFFLGTLAQVISWKLKLPSIFLLLVFGFLAGPVTGTLDPDQLFGNLLFPLVSISVAIILFEGGLSLKFKDIPGLKATILKLISVGVLVTWVILTFVAYLLLDLDFGLAILLASILTVTGPTVIIPLLNHIRPRQPLGAVLKWEGILIDPVGASLAVLVFEVLLYQFRENGTGLLIIGKVVLLTLFAGGTVGALAAWFFSKLLKSYFLPDHLQAPFALVLVIISYTVSDYFQHESGLLAVTVFGVVLANSTVRVKHILEFKETLRVLLIAALFIILAGRLDLAEIQKISMLKALLFVAITILIVRPLAVFASTYKSGLNFREKLFLSLIAPRGIVAAAVASIFSLQLVEVYGSKASLIASYVFMVIVGTVVFYSFTGSFFARLLGINSDNSRGILIMGANLLCRSLASELNKNGFTCTLTDTNPRNIFLAQKVGLRASKLDILHQTEEHELDLSGMGRFLALTPNNEANTLASVELREIFTSSGIYQLPPADLTQAELLAVEQQSPGRFLFNQELTYLKIWELLSSDYTIKTIELNSDKHYNELISNPDSSVYPIAYILPDKSLEFNCLTTKPVPKTGWKVIVLSKD